MLAFLMMIFVDFLSFAFVVFHFKFCYFSFWVFSFLISLAYPFPRLSVGAGNWRGILENANALSYCIDIFFFVCLWCEKERFNEKQRDYYLEQLQSIEMKI